MFKGTVSNLKYDANGNILSLKRNKNTDQNGNNAMDDFVYHYDPNKPNQLKSVEDKHTQATDAEDLKTQPEDNYEYNEIGQLVYNKSEGIEYLYTTSGLVSEIKKSNTTVLKFFYNDRGQRVRKESYHPETGAALYTEVYVRDAAGTPLAIYRDGELQEHTVYGQSRLGVYKRQADQTFYELTDHLGNVRAVISKDTEQQVTGTDYYPFGMAMPLRNSLSDYRYAYQGQEKDAETGKEAFQLRLWDARIGRWLTTDPYGQYASPYLGMGNNPVRMIDPDGGRAETPPPFQGQDYDYYHDSNDDTHYMFLDGGWTQTNAPVDVYATGYFDDFLRNHVMNSRPQPGYITPMFPMSFADLGIEAISESILSYFDSSGNTTMAMAALFSKGKKVKPTTAAALAKTQLTSAQQGNLIGWGTGQSSEAVQQTINITTELTSERVKDLAGQGLRKDWVHSQLTKYKSSLEKGGVKLNNSQLPVRKDLMERILELWD